MGIVLNTGPRPWTWEKTDPLKNGHFGKTRRQWLKALLFFSKHMKDNVEVVQFHIKIRDVQCLFFVEITFENCALNFYFQNSKSGIKNFQFASLLSIERFRMFTHVNVITALVWYEKKKKASYSNHDIRDVTDNKTFWRVVKPLFSEKVTLQTYFL